MAAGGTKSFHRVGSLMRSKSEGTLIDLSDSASTSDNLNGKILSVRNEMFLNVKTCFGILTDPLTKL